MKNVVILGGSYAGVSSVHYILQHVVPQLPNSAEYKVVLVSPSAEVVTRPATVRALISDDLLPQDQVWSNVKSILGTKYNKSNFQFVLGKATELDTEGRVVLVELSDGSAATERIEYHALVIATGASTPSPLFSLKTDGEGLKSTWAEFRKALPGAKKIVFAGGGPTAVEAAAELGEHLNGRAGWFGSNKAPKVPITLVTSASQILPFLRESIGTTAEGYLAQLGVTVIKNAKVTSVTPDAAGVNSVADKARLTLSNGQEIDADLYIPAFGFTPNTSFVPGNLLASDGRVNVNPSTLRVDAAGPRVYSIGDVSNYARASIYFIRLATPILGNNLKRDLLIAAGKDEASAGKDKEWKEDPGETMIVSVGRSKGVGAMMGMKLPSWFVWALKSRNVGLSLAGGFFDGKAFDKP
ncbi:uncharacterized protein DNG_02094 [Cephalotrichum gorgonifer]|uniref:FAD/NAD(P)-binding domain-containing protein n=1 Tax=Cephalotrichum gorgonifer TaxID=2041049 RepID=A0AAE8SSD3_9PEZI|nr:uncharacterized protein DNG_02094 [Cephalotrichum gorgonifer]